MAYPRVRVTSRGGDPTRADRTLTVHPRTAKTHGLVDSDGQQIEVRCADRCTTVSVRIDKRLGQGSWTLSAAALANLELTAPVVDRIHFRVKWDGASGSSAPRLSIGPVIGILAGARREQLRQNRHGFPLLDLVWNVKRMGGLVYFFAVEDIDWERRSILGFVHLPDTVKWEEGHFPFPGAIYRRWPIRVSLFRHMAREMTPNLFNAYASNKLAQAHALQQDARLAGYLPETRPLDSEAALVEMLDRYGAAYVKNTSVGAGKGVFRVEKFRGGFAIRAREKSKRADEVNAWAGGYSALVDYVTAKAGRPFEPGRWAVQQAISLARIEGRRVDFRVTVQKDGLGGWGVKGSYARVAPSEEAVITRRGAYRRADVTLRALWPRRWQELEDEMTRTAVLACERLERAFGLLGDVGVDFGVDPWGNTWFLEANPGPGYRPINRSNQDRAYWNEVEGPLRYASHLCGFGLRGP